MNTSLQKSASIQPRKSNSKFADTYYKIPNTYHHPRIISAALLTSSTELADAAWAKYSAKAGSRGKDLGDLYAESGQT